LALTAGGLNKFDRVRDGRKNPTLRGKYSNAIGARRD
jgi:hypothetical protein